MCLYLCCGVKSVCCHCVCMCVVVLSLFVVIVFVCVVFLEISVFCSLMSERVLTSYIYDTSKCCSVT